MVNKHGWIRIVEAFVAVLLIAGLVLVVLGKGYLEQTEPEDDIYEAERAVLTSIQLNESLRSEVLGVATIPIESTEGGFPSGILNKINNTAQYLNCSAKICSLDDNCIIEFIDDKNIYTREIPITTNSTSYNPRKLKIFCFVK